MAPLASKSSPDARRTTRARRSARRRWCARARETTAPGRLRAARARGRRRRRGPTVDESRRRASVGDDGAAHARGDGREGRARADAGTSDACKGRARSRDAVRARAMPARCPRGDDPRARRREKCQRRHAQVFSEVAARSARLGRRLRDRGRRDRLLERVRRSTMDETPLRAPRAAASMWCSRAPRNATPAHRPVGFSPTPPLEQRHRSSSLIRRDAFCRGEHFSKMRPRRGPTVDFRMSKQ